MQERERERYYLARHIHVRYWPYGMVLLPNLHSACSRIHTGAAAAAVAAAVVSVSSTTLSSKYQRNWCAVGPLELSAFFFAFF